MQYLIDVSVYISTVAQSSSRCVCVCVFFLMGCAQYLNMFHMLLVKMTRYNS